MGRGRTAGEETRKRLQEAGFEISEAKGEPHLFHLKKYNFLLTIDLPARSAPTPKGAPGYLVNGRPWRLEDRGYQKFWWLDGRRIPALAVQLQALHQCEAEVRALLGLPSIRVSPIILNEYTARAALPPPHSSAGRRCGMVDS